MGWWWWWMVVVMVLNLYTYIFVASVKEVFNYFLYLNVPYHSHCPVSYHSMQNWRQKTWSILSSESCHVYLGIHRAVADLGGVRGVHLHLPLAASNVFLRK